jgi:ATP-dependent Lon protease
MAGYPTRIILPIIPLARDAVLLPGITLRIPIFNRTDIPALLNAVYTQAGSVGADAPSIQVGCVPLCSPLLSPEGLNLLEDSEHRVRKTAEHLANNPSGAEAKDLFGYGVIAKIAGVQGRRPGELALVVEGTRRFRVERFTQFKPYMECEVTPLGEECESCL